MLCLYWMDPATTVEEKEVIVLMQYSDVTEGEERCQPMRWPSGDVTHNSNQLGDWLVMSENSQVDKKEWMG